MYKVEALALKSATGPFERLTIERNVPGPDDVRFDLKFCGICHSDVHLARNAMMPKDSPWATKYPIVPGHELAGVVTEVGLYYTVLATLRHIDFTCQARIVTLY
jgi:uncharacterized zinc-type alcohol dehydrogenase-like protein